MNAYKVEAQSNEDGQLASSSGAIVKVTVLEQSCLEVFPNLLRTVAEAQISHGTLKSVAPYRYDDPFEPAVPMEDWKFHGDSRS